MSVDCAPWHVAQLCDPTAADLIRAAQTKRIMTAQSIFGLTAEQIVPFVERAVGTPVSSLSINLDHAIDGHPGRQGEKLIPTFIYNTPDGRSGRIVLFVKRLGQREPIESAQYRHLQQHGAPIPRLYGAIRDADNREILFVEYLEQIYTDDQVYHRPDLLQRFIRLVATLNALPTDETYEALPHHGAVHPLPPAQVPAVEQIAQRATKRKLGAPLAAMFAAGRDVRTQIDSNLRRLGQANASFPMGFVHGDLWPHHVGSRSTWHDMLAVDLGLSLFASRFFDIAPFVGPSDDLPALSLTREDIADCYLEAYAASGAPRIDRDVFLAEVDAVWLAWNSRRLSWLAEPALGGDAEALDRICWLLSLILQWKEGEPLHPSAP